MVDDFFNTMVRLINISPRATFMNVTFDELKNLFETDPAAAEVKVTEIMEEYISSLDPERQQRARAFNWRIQQELRKFKDPVARMNRMVEMFWDGVKEFRVTMGGIANNTLILDQKGEPSVVKFPEKP